MTDQHPITPPPELVERFQDLGNLDAIALAYQAGADQELEACCEWVSKYLPYLGDFPMPEDKLRAARRPKPPSLKEQALEQLREVNAMLQFQTTGGETSAIRRALEQLND